MQHQIANLAGSLDGSPPLLLGATVDGPTRGMLKIGDVPDGARATPWPQNKDPYAPFNIPPGSYINDVACWQTVEPADDYTIPTALIFARACSEYRGAR
jgi:endoglucanase